jgi:DNA-binding NarL/FixJ family response regulator
MKDKAHVLIVDDHPLFREGMRGRLDRLGDITVVGEAASGDEAVELARR